MSKSCEVVVMVTVEDPVPWGVNEYQTSGSPEKGELTVQLTVVPLMADPLTVRDVGLDDKSLAGAGAGMAKPVDVIPVRPVEMKAIVALDTAAALVAVRLVKVATPEEADLEVVPPIVQVPNPTVAVMDAELLVTVLPY